MSEEILGKNDRLEHHHQSVQSEQPLEAGPDILPTSHRSGSVSSSSSLPRAATTPRRVGARLVETYGTVVLRQLPRKHSAPEKVLFEYARFLVGVVTTLSLSLCVFDVCWVDPNELTEYRLGPKPTEIAAEATFATKRFFSVPVARACSHLALILVIAD